MSSPISRRPAGLLDLLLSQQQGKNPSNLLDTLQPTINLGPFYESDRVSVATAVKVTTAVGNNADVEIPAGEAWKFIGAGLNCAWAAANQDIRVGLSFIVSGTSSYVHDFGLQAATGVGDRLQQGFFYDGDLVLPPGTTIRGRVNSLDLDAQANISVTLSVLYVRMEV